MDAKGSGGQARVAVRTLRNPLNGFGYTRAPLTLSGTVTGLFPAAAAAVAGSAAGPGGAGWPGGGNVAAPAGGGKAGHCDGTVSVPVPSALVEVWQADAFGRFDRAPLTPLAAAHARAGTLPGMGGAGDPSAFANATEAEHAAAPETTQEEGGYQFSLNCIKH